jgi:hypothetical protein
MLNQKIVIRKILELYVKSEANISLHSCVEKMHFKLMNSQFNVQILGADQLKIVLGHQFVLVLLRFYQQKYPRRVE